MGAIFQNNLKNILTGPEIKEIRGKGLFVGVEFNNDKRAYEYSNKLLENGLLAKPTHKNIIRFSPPLIIKENQLN